MKKYYVVTFKLSGGGGGIGNSFKTETKEKAVNFAKSIEKCAHYSEVWEYGGDFPELIYPEKK